ncbi:tyrosine-type recombinase/integrase [Reichenbachiella ulvae]|uniref:Tyrosine-type recombinase/integrase n=1 Tax=Reichenbachiella ulvae TaxID=2980104 RepID=A0ABT3CUZ4_9BACT|nr:tyrosine-type recombinase/integrase [Reichenbachiella ulvae]MCV9387434.1 tyrosine-type recombinase/integrase [Reichenbachiella ulvae]
MTASNYQKTKEGFESYLKSKHFTRKSIKSRMVVLRLYCDWLDKENLEAESISYSDLLLYMKYRAKKGTSQKTIQHYMGTVRHFYDHLIREGKTINNPASEIEIKGIKRKVLYHILEPHELQALYNNYQEETPKGIRNKVILGLLVNQGLRTDELAKLEVKDIKLREGIIDVPGGIKSNSREMKLEAHQVMEMYDYTLRVRQLILEMKPKRTTQTKQETDKLFVGDGGNCYSFSNFMTQLMVKVRKLNPSVQNAKQIRASVITKWLRMYNLREVQYLAGHRYISSTESFLENEMEGLAEEVQQFHPLG